jgi:hypothetical protein
MSANSTSSLSHSDDGHDQEDDASYDAQGAISHDTSALGLTFDQPQSGNEFDTVYDRLSKNILSHSGREDEDSLPFDKQDQQRDSGDMAVEGCSGTVLRDLEQLRNWQKRSERDCDKLRKENQRLSGEMEMLKKQSDERYRALLGEKAALAEKIYVSD